MPGDANAADDPPKQVLFLSYARNDRRRARQLARALAQAGFTVWWDDLIEGGASFASSIDEALDRADAVVVLWSNASVHSDWVRDEAAQARDVRKLVPLSLDGVVPPLGFRQYHTIDLTHWRGRAHSPEVVAIGRAVAMLAGQTPPPLPPPEPTTRRAVLVGGSVAALLAAGGGASLAWREGWLGGPGSVARDSIAVLPLRNLSGNPEQAYFSDGLTEEVRTALRRVDALQVVGAASSETQRDSKDDARTIAGKLHVAYLLEGSVQRAGDTVRIALDLTDGSSGFSKWSNRFDRRITDIFAVQTEIAQTVAQALSVQMATASPPVGGTTDVGAYEHFLRGRALFNEAKDEPTDRAALAQFDLALAADPHFAMAHAARSRSLAAIAAEYAPASQLRPLYGESIAAARRAVAIAPDLAEAQLALGYATFTGRLDIAAARPFYDRSSALGRGNSDILLLFALYCSRASRPGDARAAIMRAIALDPLNPRVFRAAGSIAYAARRYADSLGPIAHALSLNPTMANAHYIAGFSLMQLGRLPQAGAAVAAEPHLTFRLAGLAMVDHKLGNEVDARRSFDRLVRELGDSAVYQQAEVLAQWGDHDRALAALERARAVGDSGLIYLATDPLLDPIRGEPRFARVLNGLALP